MSKTTVFQENKLLGGFSLAVRDDWSFKIKRVHITEFEKDEYEKKFGEEIITYSNFFEWWQSLYKEHNSKFNKNDVKY
ncbi:MAG: hypothetical protein JXR68_02535 [Bacteroidales bacterium]|nr:hypothetical protein [Bacteroidales bacterium]